RAAMPALWQGGGSGNADHMIDFAAAAAGTGLYYDDTKVDNRYYAPLSGKTAQLRPQFHVNQEYLGSGVLVLHRWGVQDPQDEAYIVINLTSQGYNDKNNGKFVLWF